MDIKALAESVTAKIISELERGCAPWVKPWKQTGPRMPRNAVTKREYNGVNVLLLWLVAQARLYPTLEYLTFKQALSAGGCVRKGEKGTSVVFVKRITRGEEEDAKSFSMLKNFTVFNVAQIDGLTAEETQEVTTPVDTFIAATNATIHHGYDQAFFSPTKDVICMPSRQSFTGEEHYHATLLHELTHWTGHKSRLDRDFSGRFGTESYAAEELVAELGAAFLCAHLGVPGELRHAGYIGHWLKILKDDPRVIFTASSKASQAADYLRSFSEEVADEAA